MAANEILMDTIEQCHKLILKTREDCFIPPDKFCGHTASVLESIRQAELDRFIDIYKQLKDIL